HPHGKRHAAHDECSENAPKQHLVLINRRHPEIGEDHEKDEEIIDTQGFFNEITSEEGQSGIVATPQVHAKIEQECQHNPHGAPAQSFFHLYHVCLTMEYPQIERQHHEHERTKAPP